MGCSGVNKQRPRLAPYLRLHPLLSLKKGAQKERERERERERESRCLLWRQRRQAQVAGRDEESMIQRCRETVSSPWIFMGLGSDLH
jgi:hypothetical protein